jgi:hypothetical protein
MNSAQAVDKKLNLDTPVVHSTVILAEPPGAPLVEAGDKTQPAGERGIQDLAIFELVDLPEARDKESEISRRISLTPLPNQLAHQFLLTDNDSSEFENVLNRLAELCQAKLRELDIRWIPLQPGDQNRLATVADKVVMATCVRLLVFRNRQNLHQGTLNTLRGRFASLVDDIVAEIQDGVADYKRNVRNGILAGAKKSASLNFKIGSDENGNTRTLSDVIGLSKPRCPLGSASTWNEAIQFVNCNHDKLVSSFGDLVWRTFRIFLYYAAHEGTTGQGLRESEATLTRLLAERGISPQQARADKRKFRQVMIQALEAHNPLVTEFVERLRAGGRTILEDLAFVKAGNSSPI